MSKPLHTRALLSAAILALASLPASAALVTSRGTLAATGSLDWAQLGVDGDLVTAPASVNTSIGGLSASVTNPGGGTFTRFDEGTGSWAGNFAVGAALLTTFGSGGSIKIDFSQGISRVGAQIQGIDWASFNGVISAYGTSGSPLETYTINDPTVDFTPDDSAMFLGISRDTADIDYVVFSITGANNLEFGINELSLSQEAVTVTPPTVPEPASLALVALSLAGLGITRRRAQR